jgi:hypothetical protein
MNMNPFASRPRAEFHCRLHYTPRMMFYFPKDASWCIHLMYPYRTAVQSGMLCSLQFKFVPRPQLIFMGDLGVGGCFIQSNGSKTSHFDLVLAAQSPPWTIRSAEIHGVLYKTFTFCIIFLRDVIRIRRCLTAVQNRISYQSGLMSKSNRTLDSTSQLNATVLKRNILLGTDPSNFM